LRLSALAASWAVSNGHLILALGDAAALLAVGTAVLGLQEGRVLEGGERRRSPIRVLSMLAGENPDRDRSLSFRRRARNADERETPEEMPPEEITEDQQTFGDLSLLIDMGIMDIAGELQLSLEPLPPDVVAENLNRQLYSESPRGILAVGELPRIVSEVISAYSHQMRYPFASALSRIEGAERLTGAEQIPKLNNRTLRFRERPSEETSDEEYETADPELMRAALEATQEAELTFRIYQWLTRLAEAG
jgi:hypothetical protein